MNFPDFEKFTLLKTNETIALPYTVMTDQDKEQTEMEWVNVKDRLPSTVINVLISYKHHNQPFTTRGYYTGKGWRVMTWTGSDIFFDEVTHWAPLPENPKI